MFLISQSSSAWREQVAPVGGWCQAAAKINAIHCRAVTKRLSTLQRLCRHSVPRRRLAHICTTTKRRHQKEALKIAPQLRPFGLDLFVQARGLEHAGEHEDETTVRAKDLDEKTDRGVGDQGVGVHLARATTLRLRNIQSVALARIRAASIRNLVHNPVRLGS